MKIRSITAAALFFMPAGACSTGKENLTDGLTIAVHPSIKTRATETCFESGDMIGLTITLADEKVFAANASLTHNGDFFGDPDVKWYDAEEAGDFKAYYPFHHDYNGDYTIRTDQTGDGYYESDLLLAAASNVKPNVSGVSLPFVHAMSQIYIVVSNNSSRKIESVELGNTVGDVVINYSTLSIRTKFSAKPIVIAAQPVSEENFRAIIAPQEAEIELTLKCNAGEDIVRKLPNTVFTGGTSYKASVTINDDFDITEVEILSDGEISGWENGGFINE